MTPPPPGPVGPLVVVTDRLQAAGAGHDLVEVVAAAVAGGARTILLREKDLPAEERRGLAKVLAGLLAPVGGTLLVAGDPDLAAAVGAAGVHLAADQLRLTPENPRSTGLGPEDGPSVAEPPASHLDRGAGRPSWLPATGRRRVGATGEAAGPVGELPSMGGDGPAGGRLVVGRSCHTVDEVRAARREGIDYVTFSPIWATSSKPGYGPAVGLAGLAEAVAVVPEVPVYALGGVEPGRAADCLRAGAAGVAVMGAIMRAADPESVVQALLTELSPNPGNPPRTAPADRGEAPRSDGPWTGPADPGDVSLPVAGAAGSRGAHRRGPVGAAPVPLGEGDEES